MDNYLYKSKSGSTINIDNYTITSNPGLSSKYQIPTLDAYIGTLVDRYTNGNLDAQKPSVSSELDFTKIAIAMLKAKDNNYIDNAPWTQPSQWITGTTYYNGEIVQNNGNMYMHHPSAGTKVSGTTAPVHVSEAGVWDGTANASCYWIYLGPVSGLSTTTYVGAPVSNNTQTSQGWISVYPTAVDSWTATAAPISSSNQIVLSSVTGTVKAGHPIVQLGANICIDSFISGTNGGAGTYQLNTPITFAGGAVGFTNLLTNTGLTRTITISKNNLVTTIAGVPSQRASSFSFSNCTVSNQVLTVGNVIDGEFINPCTAWTGTQTLMVTKQLTGTPGGIGTYYVPGAVDQLTPFSFTNNSYPSYSYWAINTSTTSTPTANDDAPYIKSTFKTNARWLGFEMNGQGYATNNQSNYSPVVIVNNRLVNINRIIRRVALPSQNMYILDLSKAGGGEKEVSIFSGGSNTPHGIGKLYVGQNDYVIPKQSNGLKISVEGDSLIAGGNGYPERADDNAARIAALLGFDEHMLNGVGGTRMVDPGSTTRFIDRIDRVIKFNPTIHLVCGNHNDISYTSAQRQKAILDYINTFKNALPNSYLIFTGPKTLEGTTINGAGDNTLKQCEMDIATVISSYKDPYVKFIPTLSYSLGDNTNNSGIYIGGNNNPNSRYFNMIPTGSDSHPLFAEHDMFNHYVAEQIKAIFLS